MKLRATEETTVEKLISSKMQNISKSKIKQWIKFEQLKVGGRIVRRIDDPVATGEQIELDAEKSLSVKAYIKPEFEILYEDHLFIAGLKPAGMITIGECTDKKPSFFKVVQTYVREKSKACEHIYAIHRIDREVAGIVLFAKNEEILQVVKNNWRANKKSYYALVEGIPEQADGKIESYLVEDPVTLKMSSTEDKTQEGAKHAVTHYQTVQVVKENALLEVQLETGRKNQIRVHLAEMGHPIIGDRRYGADDKYERQIRLYAYYLKFMHPQTRKYVEIKIPLPNNFLHLHKSDERYK